ncbi:hypothetical protein Tco_0609501, partial [Tanacetum coccineum]
VYDAKVSIRSKLHLLQTIRSKLSWNGDHLEFGREDFCLITGFRFGKYKLDPKEEDHSEFRKRVFPKIDNLKGEHLLKLLKEDVKFNQLDDEDTYLNRRKYHLDKLASNSKYEANYVFYGFVFPLKIWGLKTFSNSIHWWRKDENVIPRGVAWSNGLKFEKSCYDRLYYSKNSTFHKLTPSASEMSEPWWISSLDTKFMML